MSALFQSYWVVVHSPLPALPLSCKSDCLAAERMQFRQNQGTVGSGCSHPMWEPREISRSSLARPVIWADRFCGQWPAAISGSQSTGGQCQGFRVVWKKLGISIWESVADRMGGTAFKIIISKYFSILRTRGLEDWKTIKVYKKMWKSWK